MSSSSSKTDAIEPLRELARALRAEGLHEHNGQDCAETDAADRIESLVPALEAAFARATVKCCHICGEYIEGAALQAHEKCDSEAFEKLEAEIAALKEPMARGPRALRGSK